MTCTIPTFENLTVQSNFSLHQFLGLWYEIKWYSTEYHNESDIWYDYSQTFELENNSNHQLLVFGKARLFHEEQCFSFGPWSILANNSAKMILEKRNLSSITNLNWPYYILKTDYNHYALIYSCISNNYTYDEECNESILWIFSRTIYLSNEYLNELNDYIENILCINLTKLETTLHREKSCYILLSLGTKIYSIDRRIFLYYFIYLFLIYK